MVIVKITKLKKFMTMRSMQKNLKATYQACTIRFCGKAILK